MKLSTAAAPTRNQLSSAQFRAVIGMVLFIMTGFGLILPALPLFARHFHVGAAAVGLIFTVFAATRLAGDFMVGSLIDRMGERSVAAAGALIVGISSAAAGAAPSYLWLVILRGLGGFGSAFFLGAITAYLLGTVEPEARGRAMSMFQAAVGVGITIGPLLGGLLQAVNLRFPLYAYGVVAIVTAPICLTIMRAITITTDSLRDAPEWCSEGPPARTLPAWRRLRPLLKDSAYRAALMGSATNFWISNGLIALLSLYWVQKLHLSRGTAGLPLTIMGIAGIVVIWHAGGVTDRLGRKRALVPALGWSAVTLLLLGFTHSSWTLLLVIGLLGLGTGYAYPGPTAIVADVSTPEQRAIAVGGYRMAADVGALVGPAVAGIVAQSVSFRWAFAALAGFVMLSFLVALAARETLPSREVAVPPIAS